LTLVGKISNQCVGNIIEKVKMSKYIYYILNKADIENFLILELAGNNPHLTKQDILIPLVKQYITKNNSKLNNDVIGDISKYICEKISHLK
jgi:hypothetical protein